MMLLELVAVLNLVLFRARLLLNGFFIWTNE
jgi:hypothetical protein